MTTACHRGIYLHPEDTISTQATYSNNRPTGNPYAGREIIVVTQSFGNDGAERILSMLANEWAQLGIHVIAVQTNKYVNKERYPLSPEIEQIDIPHPHSFRPVRVLSDNSKLKSLFKEHPNAVGVAFLSGSMMKLGFLSLFVNNRIILSERNDPRQNPAKKWLRDTRDWALHRADLCVFQTEYVKRLFPAAVQNKSVVIPNPISADIPAPHVGDRRKTIVAVGRLEPQKNLPLLIHAFARFHEDHPDYKLEIYGEGNDRSELELLVAKLGLNGCASLPGFSTDIYHKMNDAAMYVSSSDFEGISNSMLEALAMGVPTVVTDCPVGGAAESIEDGVSGLLTPVGDEDALYRAMKRIIEEDGLAERLSSEAFKIRERLPLEKIAVQWVDAIWPQIAQSETEQVYEQRAWSQQEAASCA